MKYIKVVAAIIVVDDKILCMQRPKDKYDYISYKFEFPGGKIEEKEIPLEALKRELKEEMDIDLNLLSKSIESFMVVEHQYPDFTIRLHAYLCRLENFSFKRKDHIDHIWLSHNQLDSLDWAGADLPIVKRLKDYFL